MVYGLIKGIINQLASLGGFVLGLIACRIFGDNMAEIMTGILPGHSTPSKPPPLWEISCFSSLSTLPWRL